MAHLYYDAECKKLVGENVVLYFDPGIKKDAKIQNPDQTSKQYDVSDVLYGFWVCQILGIWKNPDNNSISGQNADIKANLLSNTGLTEIIYILNIFYY